MSKQKNKNKQQKEIKEVDPFLIQSSQLLLQRDDVNLQELPESKLKTEFFELAELALKGKIGSLQKARLEYLSSKICDEYDKFKNREENERRRQEAEKARERREKTRKMLRRKTKKGQPILRNLAKVQLLQIQDMIDKENNNN